MYCVIMAGGSGTRFWPYSRKSRPKQMLNILSEKSMLQMTIDRLRKLHNVEDILIVTRADLADSIRKHVSGVPAENIIVEPEGKNTAPCIGLAALHIAKRKKNSIMGVFPADHLIVGYKEFEKAINTSSFLAKKNNSLVTIGIQPTFPSIAYGYIQYKSDGEMEHMNAYSVKAFAEKPHLDLAKRFLKSKDFLWNGGIFIWSIATFMENIKSHMPKLNDQINKISKRIDKGVSFDDIWTNITPESIDYGLMEKAKNIIVVKAKFDWSDLGSWNIIHDISPKNKDRNTIRGDALIIKGRNNFVQSNGQFIALLGLDNVVVITTDDATLVVAKDQVEEVKNVVKYLKDDKKENLL